MAFMKFIMCLLPLTHPHPPLYKSPEEFCIENEYKPDRNISYVPLKNRRFILAGSQNMLPSVRAGYCTLGLEMEAPDQMRGEIPNFPIFKSSKNISVTSFSIPSEVSSVGLASPASLWRFIYILQTIFKAPQNILLQIFSLLSGAERTTLGETSSAIICEGSSAPTHFRTFEQRRGISESRASKTHYTTLHVTLFLWIMLWPCTYMPHVHFITHTQQTTFIATKLLQEECAKILAMAVLATLAPCLPCWRAGAAVSWTWL